MIVQSQVWYNSFFLNSLEFITVVVTFIIRGRRNGPFIRVFALFIVQAQSLGGESEIGTGSGDAVTVIAFGYFYLFIYLF